MPTLDLFGTDAGAGTPILLLHGFTTHGGAWDGIAHEIASKHRVVRLDLPGHRYSPAPPLGYGFDQCIDDIVAALNRACIEKCDVLGYSMGGRIALGLAVRHPHRIRRLILESASPGIADAEQRAERARADQRLAVEIESRPFEQFIDRWMEQPLFRTQHALPDESRRRAREIRLDNEPTAIAAALRALGTGAQRPYWNDLPSIGFPVLLINGEADAKFDGIAAAMHERLRTSTRQVIRDAGHTTHWEDPLAFTRCVIDFLHSDGDRPSTETRAHG